MTENIIVGVDPGTTTAVAAVDFRGRVVGLHSSKDMGVSQTVKFILSCGRPSLIATDVNPPPDFVSTIASQFGVTLYVPDKPLPVADKLILTRGYKADDAHQRDALAAALFAYMAFKNKFQKIDSLGLPDTVKHLLLQGNSISAAKAMVDAESAAPDDGGPQPEGSPQRELSADERRIRDLERRVKALQDVIDDKDRALSELSGELARARRVEHTKPEPKSPIEKRIHSLQVKLNQLAAMESLLKGAMSGELLLVGTYPQTAGGLTLMEVMPETLGGVATAFTSTNKVRQHLLDKGVSVYDSSELLSAGEYHYIQKKLLKELQKPKEAKTDIEKLITDYRRKRA